MLTIIVIVSLQPVLLFTLLTLNLCKGYFYCLTHCCCFYVVVCSSSCCHDSNTKNMFLNGFFWTWKFATVTVQDYRSNAETRWPWTKIEMRNASQNKIKWMWNAWDHHPSCKTWPISAPLNSPGWSRSAELGDKAQNAMDSTGAQLTTFYFELRLQDRLFAQL